MTSLRDALISELRDLSISYGCAGTHDADLFSTFADRLADRLDKLPPIDEEFMSTVVVPPGGTLVLRLSPGIDPASYDEFMQHLEELKLRVPFKVAVFVAEQLGVYGAEEHRARVDVDYDDGRC